MLIVHANAFLEGEFCQDSCVRLENGKVKETGRLSPYPGEEIADLNGDALLPGFVDVHIHAYLGRDTMEGEGAVRHMSRELRKIGVAGFLPTTMSASIEATRAALSGIASVMTSPEEEGARVLGAHMEAPFLNPDKCGAQVKEHFLPPSLENWRRVAGGYEKAVRLITLAPELPGAQPLVKHLCAEGIVVSVGHTCASSEETRQAADWGASHVTHTFNAQTPLNHRAPGVPGAALTDSRLYAEMICDGIHLHPEIIRLICLAKGREKAVMITDAMEAAGMPDGTYALGGQNVYVRGGAARLENGTLAGSTLTMARAFTNMVSKFSIPPRDAAYMCTAAPAESVGEPLLGRIVPGAPAILTRWDESWELKQVF